MQHCNVVWAIQVGDLAASRAQIVTPRRLNNHTVGLNQGVQRSHRQKREKRSTVHHMGFTKYFVNATHIYVYHPDTATQKRQVTKTLVAVKMAAQHLLSRLPTLRQTCYGPRTRVSWSLTSLFSTNMAISETKGQGRKVIRTQ